MCVRNLSYAQRWGRRSPRLCLLWRKERQIRINSPTIIKTLFFRGHQWKVTMKNHRRRIHLKYLFKLQIKLFNMIQSTKHNIKRHSTALLYITVLVAQNVLTFQYINRTIFTLVEYIIYTYAWLLHAYPMCV